MTSWCDLQFTSYSPPAKEAYLFLLSCVAFFFPGYSKTNYRKGVIDVSHHRQRQMMSTIRMYKEMFREVPWFREYVIVRMYYDDSLFMYKDATGSCPWESIIEELRGHPGFQMVRYDCFSTVSSMADVYKGRAIHRGLLGTMVRFHAACDQEFEPRASCVCLVDMDSLYTAEWWKEHINFFRHDEPKKHVLTFTSVSEIALHGYVPPEHWRASGPFMKAGLTSFRTRLPANAWESIPSRLEEMRPLFRYMDVVRLILYGPESNNERSYEDFGYGFDEALLNFIVRDYWGEEHILISQVKRNDTSVLIDSVLSKLLGFLVWAGDRSVPATALAKRMSFASVDELVRWLSDKAKSRQVRSIDALESQVLSRLRPYLPIMERMQIDGRLLTLISHGVNKDARDANLFIISPPLH